jgi:hypothetical protein
VSTPPTTDRPSLLARLCTELKRLLVLAVVVGLIVVAGKYYCFDRLDEEIRVRVENVLRDHYRGLNVSVKSARRVAGQGIEIRGVRIAEAGGKDAPVLAEIGEIFAVCDTRLPDFLTRPPHFTALRVQRLKLRAERKPSGLWNLSHLVPLPPSQGQTPPVATITDSALEIFDPSANPACSWTLRNIELTVQPQLSRPNDSSPHTSREVSLAPSKTTTMLHVRGTLAGDHLERVEIDGLLDPATGGWDVRGAVEGLEFSPRLRAALPHELSTALAPLSSIRGRTYFGFHAQRAASPQTSIQFTVHGNIAEGRVDDARLPEPLTDVEAQIHIDNQGVRIKELSARCGATQIELSAAITGFGNGPIEIEELSVRQLQLERWPPGSLPPQLRETWQRFSPRGIVDLSGTLRFDGRRWQPNLTVRCHDLSLLYDKFAYRVTDGSGTLEVQPDFVRVRLRMQGGGQFIRCDAEVRSPGPAFTGWIDIATEGPIPLDDKLLAALEPQARTLVRSFRPRGSAKLAAHYVRQPGDAVLHRRVNVELHDCSIQHERFSYPIDKVRGLLELTDDNWTFRNLSGRNDSAAISGYGSYHIGPSGKELILNFQANDVPLAEELRQALPPGIRRLWANLRPRGNIDFLKVRLGYTAANSAAAPPGQWSIDVEANKFRYSAAERPISLEPAWFRYALDNLSGDVHYHDGQMELTNLHAVHGHASVSAAGVCRVQPDGSCRLDLTRLDADQVRVDSDLLAALPAGMGQALGRFPLEGPLNIGGTLGLTVSPQPEVPPQLDWNLSLALENARLATPTPIESLFGEMQLAGRQGVEGLFCRGELRFESAMVRGVQLTHLNGPFFFDGRKLVFGGLAEHNAAGQAPRQVTARVLGGTLAAGGDLALAAGGDPAFGDEGPFQVQLALGNANLSEIARQLTPQQRGLSGRVDGEASISGTAQGKHTWRGNGQLRLRDADIYQLPLMVRLLSLLSVKPPDRTAFTTSDIDFVLAGDDLTLTKIDFSGDAISLKGKGEITGQRQIDLKFYPVVGREEWHLPILRPLLGQTGRELMLIEVTGTLDRMDLKRTPFPKFDERLQRIFPELVPQQPQAPTVPIVLPPKKTWGLPQR